MKNGRVYWITGLAGVGKTTLGVALYYKLKEQRNNVIILDGDILKLFVGDKVGYTTEDRLNRARKYSVLCKTLADQGMYVIICTIAMFDEIRLWNRNNINGYIEIFLDVPLNILRQRDKKKLYGAIKRDNANMVVGVDSPAEFPQDPDLRLVTDGSLSVDECVDRILRTSPRFVSDYDRDSTYWNSYYAARKNSELKPSQFARFFMHEIPTLAAGKLDLLEIGCGNGRDSLYFLSAGFNVTGIDASEYAVNCLRQRTGAYTNAIFVCDDFVTCKVIYQRQFDYIYSRFTLHAINAKQQTELFGNIAGALKQDGQLFIEARTIHDELYGRGKQVAEHAFIFNDHYRRFVDKDAVADELCDLGFTITYLTESKGFSKTDSSDPTLMRLVATYTKSRK